jgi:hypothetical protein
VAAGCAVAEPPSPLRGRATTRSGVMRVDAPRFAARRHHVDRVRPRLGASVPQDAGMGAVAWHHHPGDALPAGGAERCSRAGSWRMLGRARSRSRRPWPRSWRSQWRFRTTLDRASPESRQARSLWVGAAAGVEVGRMLPPLPLGARPTRVVARDAGAYRCPMAGTKIRKGSGAVAAWRAVSASPPPFRVDSGHSGVQKS